MSSQLLEIGTTLDDLAAEFHSVVESLNEGLVLADNDGLIRFSNARFTELTGFTREEVRGKRVYEVFFPADSIERKQEAERMRERYEARKQGLSETYETNIIRKDGQRRWIETKAAPLLDGTGRIVGSIGANSDITDRKLLEEQLRWSQKMEAVGRLAGGVAHDFNNLLTVIQGYADLLRQQMEPGDPHIRKVDVIREASDAASTLTQQLLTISRRQIVQMRPISLNDVVEKSLRVVQGLIGERVRLVVDLLPDLPLVRGDAGQLQQVLLNLVVNARDAMPDGGTLLIETGTVDHLGAAVSPEETDLKNCFARLRIEDTGVGMDSTVKARMFEPFFTTKRKGRGSGLGLSITFGIAEEHGAEIRVSSEPDQGATFDVMFPAIASSSQEDPTARSWRPITGNETILLAEDHTAVRVLVKESLERYGYKVIEADDGREALEILQRPDAPSIDLLVTDLVMPRMNGIELAQSVVALLPATKVLVISGYADEPSMWQKSRSLGFTFLAKPFSPETLAQLVRSVLDSDQRAIAAATI